MGFCLLCKYLWSFDIYSVYKYIKGNIFLNFHRSMNISTLTFATYVFFSKVFWIAFLTSAYFSLSVFNIPITHNIFFSTTLTFCLKHPLLFLIDWWFVYNITLISVIHQLYLKMQRQTFRKEVYLLKILKSCPGVRITDSLNKKYNRLLEKFKKKENFIITRIRVSLFLVKWNFLYVCHICKSFHIP